MNLTKVDLWLATIEHRHGVNAYVAASEALLYEQLYEYVKGWWHEVQGNGSIPEDHSEAIEVYFEFSLDRGQSEYLDTSQATIQLEDITEPVAMELNACPLCKGETRVGPVHDVDDGYMMALAECQECGHTYKNIYSLVRRDNLDETDYL